MRAAFGVVPPDLSVMAKARAIASPFPQWVFNYFTTVLPRAGRTTSMRQQRHHEAPAGPR